MKLRMGSVIVRIPQLEKFNGHVYRRRSYGFVAMRYNLTSVSTQNSPSKNKNNMN